MASSLVLASTAAAPMGGMGSIGFIIQIVLLIAVFYFLMVRPQQKRAKEHEARINAVQKNDEVVTGGGLMGKVTKVTEDYVEVEIAAGVRVKAVKSTLVSVSSRTKTPAND